MPATPFARRFGWFLIAVLCLVAARGAWASSYYWTGAGTGGNTATDPADPTTQWAGAANWTAPPAPGSSATVYLPLGNAGSVYAATTTLGYLYVDGPSAAGALCITDGVAITVVRTQYVGWTRTGKVVQSGGTCEVEDFFFLGSEANSSGFYELSGSGVLNTATYWQGAFEFIGYSGAGTFTQSGGTHTAHGDLYLGYKPGGTGTYCLSSGDLNAQSSEYLGYVGTSTGTFTQTGGTHTVNGVFYLGLNRGSSGTYELGGTGTLITGAHGSSYGEYIGCLGSGNFIQTGGTHTANGTLYVGYGQGHPGGSSGSYSLSLGDLKALSDEYIGSHSTQGTFTQTGGTHTVTGNLYLGYLTVEPGTYSLSSGDLKVLSSEYVGGPGTFSQTGGTHTVSSSLEVGGAGTYELGGGLLSVPTVHLNDGSFRWTGGTLDVQTMETGWTSGRLFVGLTADFAGSFHANGGAVEVDTGDTLTLLGEFGTTQEGMTATKEGAGALRITGSQVYAPSAVLSVAEGTVFMDTAAGDETTHNLEVDVGGAGSDALVVFETDEHLSMLHILDGGTVRLGDGCQLLVLDALWIDGVGQFQNITWTNTPEPATIALVAFGGLGCWARRARKRRSR